MAIVFCVRRGGDGAGPRQVFGVQDPDFVGALDPTGETTKNDDLGVRFRG